MEANVLEVLIVDDSAAIRASLSMILRAADIRVAETSSAEDALALLMSGGSKPDLCIVDLNMPGMDGITLIRRMRTMHSTRFTPILMLTTESQQSKRQEARAAGATGWLVKPISPSELMQTVRRVCPGA
jgi:two-component system, chemotaxis family, chemotaxis protein CheY